MKRTVLIVLFVMSMLTMVACSKTNSAENVIVHEEGRTGYSETICDIIPDDSDREVYSNIHSVMKSDDSYYAITKDRSAVDGSTVAITLYQISISGDVTNTVQLQGMDSAEFFVLINDNIVCIGNGETTVISAQDGSIVTSYGSDIYPMAASAYGEDYVVCYSDHILLMDTQGNVKSRIDNDFGWFEVYCDCLYEYEDRLYLVACPGFEYVYYEVNFDNQSCSRVSSSTDWGIELSDCCGGYIFDKTGEYKIDPATGAKTLLAEWNNTNVRPGGHPASGYRYYYVFDDEHFAKSYISEDGTVCIQMYEYDPSIDYSQANYITVGGIALNTDYALQDAIYRYNSSQSEYRVITQEFENDGWDNEYELERNSRLIAEFSSGNAPDIFYGDMFDYEYFGRNDLVIDMLPYLQESDCFNVTDIEPSLWNVMSRDGHCYHLFNSFQLYGYWGKQSVMADNTNMTYEELLSLNNPDGTTCSTIYSWWIADYILGESSNSFIDNGRLAFTEDQIEDIVEVALTYGLPSSAGFELLGPVGMDYLRSNEYLMNNATFGNLCWYNEDVRIADDNLSFIGFPSVNGAYHSIFTSGTVAVSSSTLYPEACVDFISYMFDDQAQEHVIVTGGNSVRVSINDEFFDYAMNPSGEMDSIYGNLQLPEDGVAEEVVNAYREAISMVDTQYVSNPAVVLMIQEELDTYELQGKSIEAIAESLYSRLSLYVDEVYQ